MEQVVAPSHRNCVGTRASAMPLGFDKVPNKFETHLDKRGKCGLGALKKSTSHKAKCHDLIGVKEVDVQGWRCVRKSCAAQHGPNYYFDDGAKMNTATVEDLHHCLFSNAKRCFTLRYLEFLTNLQFRTGTSDSGIAWAYKKTYEKECAEEEEAEEEGYGRDILVDFRKLHADACMYYLAIREFSHLGLHKEIELGQEITNKSLEMYDFHLHEHVFPPADPSSVKEVVMDGHMKVLTKCVGKGLKRSGRPARTKRSKRTNLATAMGGSW